MTSSAAELYQRGVDQANNQKLVQATRTLTRAFEATDDPELQAQINGSLAYAMSQQGHGEQAEALCRETLADQTLSDSTRILVLGQLGTVLLHAGRWRESTDALTEALQRETDRERRASLLMNRSVAAMRLLDLVLARHDLEEAIECFPEGEEGELDRAFATHNLGYLSLLQGDIIEALRLMDEARPLVSSSPAAAAICDVDRAEALREAGDVADADRLLESAAAEFGRQRMPQARAEAELALAISQLTFESDRAIATARRAATRFRRVGSEVWALRADAVGLRARMVRLPSASTRHASRYPTKDDVEKVARALVAHHQRADARVLRFSFVASESRRGAPPKRAPRLEPGDSLNVRVIGHEARAARSTALRRDADARCSAAAGLEELSDWVASFGALDLLTSVAHKATGLLMEGAAAAVRSGDASLVFEWAERARHFNNQVAPLRPPPDPELAADLAQLRTLRLQLRDGVDGPNWVDNPAVVALRSRMSDRQWVHTAATEGIAATTLSEVRAELHEDEALLSYIVIRGGLVCLAIPGDPQRQPSIIRLPWRRVQAAQRGLRGGLEMVATTYGSRAGTIVRRDVDQRLEAISHLLLDRAIDAVGDPGRVVLTIPGALREVAWQMMPALRDRLITIPQSVSVWMAQRQTPLSLRSAGFAAGPDIPRAEVEVMTAAVPWGPRATVIMRERATSAAVTTLANEVDVLHVAAHGRHVSTSPMLSGFRLADGPLFGYDIDLIENVPDLIVLSACELGRSTRRGGDETIGMVRSWQHAGAQCVIASPVVIADEVAAEVLSAMHEGLAAGNDPAQSLYLASVATGHTTPFVAYGSAF
ncbi:MAG: CHAT domain-containing tetratricopeptide repeat protein [Microbacterium sp.]